MLQAAELELVIPLTRAGVVRLGGDQVTPGDQLAALEGGVVMNRLPVTTRGAMAPR